MKINCKVGDKVTIGGVVLAVLAVEGVKVRLGFDAPRKVRIYRSELLSGTPPAKPKP